MANVSYRLEDLKKAIVGIGYVGENDHMHVLIDCKEVFDEYPDAVATMAIVPPVGESYPKVVNRNGDVVEWLVKNSDVAAEGDGEFQITFTEGEVIKKSVNGRFRVIRSISGSGNAPSGYEDWETDANEKLAAVEEATQKAEDAAEHQPRINASGYWEIWDAETGAYVATSTKAQGDKGDPGDPGTPGDPTELIDDTAGSGTTGKTWSADKINDVTYQLSTDIQGLDDDKYEKPSGGIPAIDMTEEVQNTLSAVGKSEERDGIVQTGDTATQNITKDQYVVWKGELYTASVNIAIGETLSLSNLDPVSDGGFNALHEEIASRHRIKAYKKDVIQEETRIKWVTLDNTVYLEVGDEIEIIIYQSDKETSGTSWSNTELWNAVAIQNKNHNSIQFQDWQYLNSNKPALIRITKKTDHFEYVIYTNNTFKTFGVDFQNNFDSFDRMQLDAANSTIKVGCTIEITIKNTL